MFGVERIQKIRDILLVKKHINVSTLSAILQVSEVTIRKDLEKLEMEGFIKKSRGGAILNDDMVEQSNILSKPPLPAFWTAEEQTIGNIAALHVEDGNSIFLGVGSTCQHVALSILEKKNVNVVTNDLVIAKILAANRSISVLVLGGIYYDDTMSLSGDVALQYLSGIHVDKAFLSVDGIHLNNGITIARYDQLNIYKYIVERADKYFLLADYTKIGKVSFVKLGDIDFAKTIITNENIPLEYKAYFFDNDIQIFSSYQIV